MIPASDLREMAGRDGGRPEEVEKEYLQYAFLHSLAADIDGLAFRGGTMLRIAHGHSRYSEDLDFLRLHGLDEAEASVEAAIADVVHWGIRVQAGPAEIGKNTAVWRLRFRGPLYASTHRENRVKVEAGSTDEHHLPPETSLIRSKFADVPAFTLPTQDRRETAAEKVRALVERDAARDLYDLAHLVDQGWFPPPDLLEKKLGWRPGAPPRPVQPHARSAYERDLRDWVPSRAHLPWEAAWSKVRPHLEGLRCMRLPPQPTTARPG